MTRGLFGRLLGTFMGALCGYIVGWALGWSLFDPNSDLWALGALIGALLGLLLGVSPGFWKRAGIIIGATIGLYVGWILRTLLFGDLLGGMGVLLIVGGAIAGGMIGRHRVFREDGPALRALTLGLLVGFVGGLAIDLIVMNVLDIVSSEGPPVIVHAPAVLFSGLVGGICGLLSGKPNLKSATPCSTRRP